MERVCFKRNDGERILLVWTSTDGKVDFKALSRHFQLNMETITLNGNVFSLDYSTGKSDASWMQIKDALGVEGTEEDPVSVHDNSAPPTGFNPRYKDDDVVGGNRDVVFLEP